MEGFLAACVVAGVPLLFATVGALITEKVGNSNLGVEGMMLMGAVMAYVTAMATKNPFLTVIVAAVAGAAGALIYAILTITLKSNQIVTGLTLTIFGTGFAKFVGQPFLGKAVPSEVTNFFVKKSIPVLGDIPFLGPVFFRQDVYVYLSYVVVIVAAVYMYKTRWGTNLKAVGENTAAAD
ncbi:MAG: ABC transporter permease, partial [Firmicutes bacterium]|nr:ABC transporter permease [Bacillota bacterium]